MTPTARPLMNGLMSTLPAGVVVLVPVRLGRSSGETPPDEHEQPQSEGTAAEDGVAGGGRPACVACYGAERLRPDSPGTRRAGHRGCARGRSLVALGVEH